MTDDTEESPKKTSPAREFLQKRGNMLMHSMSVGALMALLGINTGQFDVGLATKTYVDSEIAGLKDSLDKILEINLVQELTKLYRWKCMNIGDITFDIQIAELERQYRELTGERYQRLDCKDLLELTDG